MNQATVSVIIPVYNGEKYLAAAIESVMAQTLPATQLLVIDESSTDRTAEIAQSYPEVEYHLKENQGSGAARNFGRRHSHGDFIAFLDADDIWNANKLQAQVRYLQERPQLGYAVCLQRMFMEGGGEPPSWIKTELFHSEHPAFVPSAMIVRTRFFDQIGEFDEDFRQGYDQDWFARADQAGGGLNVVTETLLLRRIHNANETSHQQSAKSLLRVVKKNMDRQRQSTGEESPRHNTKED